MSTDGTVPPGLNAIHQVTATVPSQAPPVWAVLQRRLFEVLDEAWRAFERKYCDAGGRLAYHGRPAGRDGADDFYEPFFNWPALYLLGGADDLLDAARRHWTAVTEQLTELGFLVDEFERGYDWFHQGESLLLFYGLCAADPDDDAFRTRARRFASLYLPDSPAGNYDAEHNIIRAPHNGAGGPREGLGEDVYGYRADRTDMRPYGLPLPDVPGVAQWDDLAEPANVRALGDAMQQRMGRGDTTINLCSTSLLANAWLYDNDPRYAKWITTYAGGWLSRARELGGVLPDNVGPSGRVGEDHEGRWFGGHYGWAWPHGYLSVGAAALIGAMNAAVVSGDDEYLELARVPLRQLLDQARPGVVAETPMSQARAWTERLAEDANRPVLLVPHRHGPQGWFDYQPLQTAFPTWLWWFSMDRADADLLRDVRARSGYDWAAVRPFRDKEEAGHEAPWLAYLGGANPQYPQQALAMALAQVAHRLALIAADDEPDIQDLHWWQRLNPVVTEVLTQLTTGAPQVLYNGGLQHARIRYADPSAGRPGLPPDVAALIDHLDGTSTHLTLVNLDLTGQRDVMVCGGAFGEHSIDAVTYDVRQDDYPGDPHSYRLAEPATAQVTEQVGGPQLLVSLPPGSSVRLHLRMSLRAYPPRHQSFRNPIPTGQESPA